MLEVFLARKMLRFSCRSVPVLVPCGWIGASWSAPSCAQIADAYVAPYLGEGFNLPALEAAQCGCTLLVTSGGPTDMFTLPSFSRRIPSSQAPIHFMTYVGTCVSPNGKQLERMLVSLAQNSSWATQPPAGSRLLSHTYSWDVVVSELIRRSVFNLSLLIQPSFAGRLELLSAVTGNATVLHDLPVWYQPCANESDKVMWNGSITLGLHVQSTAEGQLCVVVFPTFPFSKQWALSSVVGEPQCIPVASGGSLYQYNVHGLSHGSFTFRVSLRSDSPAPGLGVDIAGTDCEYLLVRHCTRQSCHVMKQLDVVTGGAADNGTPVITSLKRMADTQQAHDQFQQACRYTIGMSLLELGDVPSAVFALSSAVLHEVGETALHAALALLSLRPPVDSGVELSPYRFDFNASIEKIRRSEPQFRQFLENERLTNFRVSRVPILGGKFTAFPSVLHAYHHTDPARLVAASAMLLGQLFPELTSFVAPHLAHGSLLPRPGRIRVGFLSTAFCDHALGRALAGVVLKLADDPNFQVGACCGVHS
jgi:hypothetical protein